jgi:hypothetical protein
MADIRCPMCGKPNPADRETCQFCKARLKPLVVKDNPASGSQPPPATPPFSGKSSLSDREEVPDWLSSLRGAQDDSAAPESAPPSTPTAGADGDDWLARLQGRPSEPEPTPFHTEDGEPDWMNRLSGNDPAQDSSNEEPEWLQSIRRRSAAEAGLHDASTSSSTPAVPSEPDWLQSFRQTPAEEPAPAKPASPPAKPLPDAMLTRSLAEDWFSNRESDKPINPPAAQPPAKPPAGTFTAPLGDDWLKELSNQKPVQPPTPQPPAKSAAGTPFTAPLEDDWFSRLGGDESVKPPTPTPPARPPSGTFTAPLGDDWLKDLSNEKPVQPSAGQPPANAPAGTFTAPLGEDWLKELASDKPAQAPTPKPPANPPAGTFTAPLGEDWLKELSNEKPVQPSAAQPPAKAPAQPPAGTFTAPLGDDWLKEFSHEKPVQPPAAQSPAKPPAGTFTAPLGEDWLKDLGSDKPVQPPVLPAAKPVPPAPEKPAPAAPMFTQPLEEDWLSRLGGDEPLPPPAQETPAAFPDWLMDVTEPPAPSSNVTLPPETNISATPAKKDVPEWMRSLDEVYQAPAPLPPAPQAQTPVEPSRQNEPESSEFEQFLKNAPRMDDFSFPAAPAGNEVKPQEDDGILPGWNSGPTPDWLSALEVKSGTLPSSGEEAQPFPAFTQQPPAPAVPQPSADPFVSGALPDWLGELGTADRGQDGSAQSGGNYMDADAPDPMSSADLPSWVQALRPIETVAPRTPAQAPAASAAHMEDSGPLAGLRGILPAEPTIAIKKASATSTHLEVSELQERHSQILENLLAIEEQAEELPGEPLISSQRILRLAIAGILFIALLIPLLGGVQIFPTPTSAPAEVSALQSSIEALPENAPVLLVADFAPAVSGEMQAAASGVLIDLLKKGARLAVISTTPTGPALADHLLTGLIPASDPAFAAYRSGEKIVRLGYLPGGTTALAAFAADPQTAAPYTVDSMFAWEQPGLNGVHALSDFARVIVLTENANTGQAWVEQAQPKLGARSAMLVIAGAQAAPALRPYLDSHQVQGMVAGVAGGAAYEELIGRPDTGIDYWEAFQFGTWAAILIILLGALSVSIRPVLAAIRKGEGS